jgi:nucleotide-binding universal stress UspA family protein
MSVSSRTPAWPGFRSVLCPVDFSEHSRLALGYADAIAARAKTTLTVTYANDPLLVAAAAAALHDRQLAARSASELQRFIDETLAAQSAGKRPRVKSVVSIGQPADEILKVAARIRSDLVVLGTHGLTRPDRLLLGSTTLSLLQRSVIPVLAVPRSSESSPTIEPTWPGIWILAALDLHTDSRREVEIAARIAQWLGSSLLLAHVVSAVTAPAWLKGDLGAHDRLRVAQAQQQLDALAVAAHPYVKTETRVMCGDVADEIAILAATERTGLLITALRDRHGWLGTRRGSVSYQVLSHAVTPILAYPPRWRLR